ncbi:MAG: CvpA family protein [Flavobacteriales bacterium]|nr:CvpA family protein [Flavobacteriales bacterium]
MNWLDWVLIALVAFAAIKGFSRGFIVEVCSLLALVLGIWAGTHFSERVADAIGLGSKNSAVAFLVTFLIVLVGVHLLARFLTTLIDIAQLSLPNKVAGVLFGALRQAFTLSIALNLLASFSSDALPSTQACADSTLYAPFKAFAPLIVPALGQTKWLEHALDELGKGVDGLVE